MMNTLLLKNVILKEDVFEVLLYSCFTADEKTLS